jgi:hypothetical protein
VHTLENVQNARQRAKMLNIYFYFPYLVDGVLRHATFNNISVILWRSVLLVEENGVPGENP